MTVDLTFEEFVLVARLVVQDRDMRRASERDGVSMGGVEEHQAVIDKLERACTPPVLS